MLPHIFNGNGTISIMIDGKMKPIDTAHKNYEEIKQALIDQDWDSIPELVNIKEQVEAAINASTAAGKVTIRDGEVFYNGDRIHNTLTTRIVNMAKEGFNIGHMVKFLENLMKNPSYRAVTELYDFLEAGNIPITENGTFLTYKKIQSDWTDIHSGTFDNSIGAIAEMPRNMVNEDSSVTCSAGLHVCSYDYLPHFGWGDGNRVVICEVNPEDVVSIPNDYNNTKMRVCKYTVIGEVEDYKETQFTETVVNTTDVRDGVTSGMVDHSDVTAKNIGKMVTESFEEVPDLDIGALCMLAGLGTYDANKLNRIVDDGNYKRVGKKVAKHVVNGDIDGTMLMSYVENEVQADDLEEFDDDMVSCGRCQSPVEVGSVCDECGYWN